MTTSIYARRRQDLMQLMVEGAAVIPTAALSRRNGDIDHPYRPDSDFYYLTHFPEPEAVAILIPNRKEGEFLLFCRSSDPEKEKWDGPRIGLTRAVDHFGADQAFPIDELEDRLPQLLENQKKVHCFLGRYPDFDARLISAINQVKGKIRSGTGAPSGLADLGYLVHELRLFKQPAEVKLMRKAAKISAEAHLRAIKTCKPGMTEYQLQAEVEYVFRNRGGLPSSYPPIVAGGANACTLHYIDNKDTLRDGELVLIDAGAEVDCYASDITRTFPVNGYFSPAQRQLYDLVLAAHKAAVKAIKPGNHWNDPHVAATRVLAAGLIDLGLIDSPLEIALEEEHYRRFYMHRTGHWLGMDVHDVGNYKVDGQWRVLEPGMVMTVEPGLYIPDEDDIEPCYRGIGIRIEDDLLVTARGSEILSKGVPRKADAIEALMASG